LIGDYPGERCDLPAVDSFTSRDGEKKWLCAEHWDTREALRVIFDQLKERLKLRKNM
jgi:hypothetical protein